MTDLSAAVARPRAVLWDMDGTLIDTEPFWIQAEHELADHYGRTWTEAQSEELIGSALLTAGERIREGMDLDLTPQQIVDWLQARVIRRLSEGVPWLPGARELLGRLRADGIPCALVTMSWREMVAPIVASLPEGTFDAVVTGDEVDRGKPDPEPYLTGARLLGVPASECLAIEDSSTGATSAEAAGCTVLAVPRRVDIDPSPRRLFATTLEGVTPETLPDLISA